MSKVIILHGWTKDTGSWDKVLAALRSSGIAVELPRIPGLSDGTDPVWGLDDYVDWLEGVLPQEPVVLIGHSNGGRIAIAFTAKYPQRVKKLILVDSAGLPLKDPYTLLKNSVFKKIATVGRKFTSSESLRKLLYKAARVSDYPDSTPNMRKTMANLIKVDLSVALPKITVPTLIIWGANDRVTPISMAREMKAGIANSRLEIISDARHAPHITHSEQVASLITSELKS